MEQLQHGVFVFQFCRPVYQRWLADAVLAGALIVARLRRRPAPLVAGEVDPAALGVDRSAEGPAGGEAGRRRRLQGARRRRRGDGLRRRGDRRADQGRSRARRSAGSERSRRVPARRRARARRRCRPTEPSEGQPPTLSNRSIRCNPGIRCAPPTTAAAEILVYDEIGGCGVGRQAVRRRPEGAGRGQEPDGAHQLAGRLVLRRGRDLQRAGAASGAARPSGSTASPPRRPRSWPWPATRSSCRKTPCMMIHEPYGGGARHRRRDARDGRRARPGAARDRRHLRRQDRARRRQRSRRCWPPRPG